LEKFANPDAAFYAIAGLQGITGIAVIFPGYFLLDLIYFVAALSG